MVAFRRLTVAVVAATLMTLALAGAVGAGTPPSGKGLLALSDVGITSLTCPGTTITEADVIVPRGGTATWTVGGEMWLLKSIEAEGTVTPPGGAPQPVSFAQTWGNKTGLGPSLTCTFEQSVAEDGFVFESTGTVVLVQVR